jgi:methionine-R-sulfoxide reductase
MNGLVSGPQTGPHLEEAMRTRTVAIIGTVVVLGASTWLVFGPRRSTAEANAPERRVVRQTKAGEQVNVKVKVFNKAGKLVGPVEMAKVVKTDEEWQKQLTPAQYEISRGKGTEMAFCGNLLDNKLEGVYACVGCGLPLFASDSKFNSGTGWPSFFQPVAAENVVEHEDIGHGMVRTEILCARCDGLLGHVFDDGPRPTGLRFCVNSESLKFTPKSKLASQAD